jgi:CheY-like chemotaxis protein
MNILVVDDDYAIRDALSEMLDDDGHVVILATNGQEALDYLNQAPARPDLILLDLAMPVMSGKAFCIVQQQDPMLVTIPVVVLSADRGIQQKAAAMGVNTYLAKPVLMGTLLGVVARFAS